MEAYNINVVQEVNTVDQQNVRHELKLYGTVVNLSADYVEAIREIQQVRDEAIAAVNQTRDEALEEFNTNASEKQEEYNTNAAEKQGAYNNNAAEKFGEYNNNAAAKLEEYNANAAEKQAQVDNSAELARQWAVKMDGKVADEDYSSKYYADQAQTSANLANIQNKITNCLLEVPQNIKLELNNGTLTLKAGSKVYVPNGVGVFEEVVTPSDISRTVVWSSPGFITYESNGIDWANINYCFSGNTAPDNPSNGWLWYDTANNIIKRYNGSEWTAKKSLPIAILNASTTQSEQSIDQVFDGFGFIGSTAFVLPGVKGLIPNGRNEDGSLNNTEFTIDTVKINTKQNDWTQEQEQFINASGLYGRKIGDHYYDEVNNYNKRNDGAIMPYCSWGTATLTAGKISNFAPKTSFHAVDFNDFYEADSQNVKLTGNQIVKGIKTFCQSGGAQQQYLLIQNDKMTNSAPAQEQWVGITFIDKVKNWLTFFRHRIGTNGSVRSAWTTRKLDQTQESTVYHGYNASGNWESNIVITDNNRSQTISGRKTFNGSGIGIIKSGSAIDIQNTAVDLTSTSISGTTEIHFVDKNSKVQGIVEHQNQTSGNSVMILAARNHANTAWTTLECGFDANDTIFTHAPHPSSSSNKDDIATTYWVRNYSKNYGAQLNYSGAITITGTGTKTASVSGVLIGTPINTNSSEQLKIQIDGKTFFFCPGNSGEDNNHLSQCYLPISAGKTYNVMELNGNVQLLLVPYL